MTNLGKNLIQKEHLLAGKEPLDCLCQNITKLGLPEKVRIKGLCMRLLFRGEAGYTISALA